MSYTQDFFTSRKNNVNGGLRIGEIGRLWYDPATNTIRVSDGITPGGKIVSGGGSTGGINIVGSVADSSALPLPYTGNPGDAYITQNDGHIWVWDGTQWIDSGQFTGYTGSQGSSGFTGSIGFVGSQGTAGTTGFVGSQGSIGFTGSIGFIGSRGTTGFTGSQGVGYTGSQGSSGFIGSSGFTGSIGYIGSIGYVGSTGFVGSQGTTGFTGSIGYIGSQGTTGTVGFVGSQGVTGFVGSQGVGYTGSIGYSGSQGTIGYVGSTGAGGTIANWGSYASTLTQSVSTATFGIPLNVENDRGHFGVTVTQDAGGNFNTFNIPTTGTYVFSITLEVTDTGAGGGTVHDIQIWKRVNGIDQPNTGRLFSIVNNSSNNLLSTEYLNQYNQGDTVQWIWATSNTQVQLTSNASLDSFPESPSVKILIHQIAYQGYTGSQGFVGYTGSAGNTLSGVSTVNAGTDISVNTTTGNVTVTNISTLDSVASRGASTTRQISINNNTVSTSTNTGALTVLGGIGVAQNVYIGTSLTTVGTSTLGLTNVSPQIIVNSNAADPLNSSTVVINSTVPVGYSELTIKNSGASGHSYTIDVGGNNRNLTGGTSINEGNFTLYDDTNSAYRLVVTKGGNVLIGSTSDNGNLLQVNGNMSASTATFSGAITVASTLLETKVTSVNNTNTTVIDSFSSAAYRSCRCLVQVEDGSDFQITEIVLLHDNSNQVYMSQYGIISTNGEKGVYTADLLGDGILRLYFTAYSASSKTITITKTALPV